MKENLKVKINSVEEREEAQNLFHSMGSRIFSGSQFEVVVVYELMKPFKEITLPELRELARPKEYLTAEFELVVTNQPLDGWILVPEGMDIATKMEDGSILFWKTVTILVDSIVWQRNPQQDKVMKEEKKGRFLHQWAYEAFGRGEDVQIGGAHAFEYFDLNFQHSLSDFNNPAYRFRLKPQTIQIGSRTINKPISVKPEIGTVVYMPHLTSAKKVVSMIWEDNHLDYGILSKNLCHITEQDAINHTDALLELVK